MIIGIFGERENEEFESFLEKIEMSLEETENKESLEIEIREMKNLRVWG